MTAADRVFSGLVADILTGRLHPGESISERDLVGQFGVSRTPIREAIKRLLERGMLEIGPKGVRVPDISREELRQLYDLRFKLERHAAELTARHITPAEIEELERANQEFARALGNRNLVEMLDVRANFHNIAVHASRNRWLAEIVIILRDKAYAVRHRHWQDPARAAQTLSIHSQMIEALRRQDEARYVTLVVEQIQAALDWYMDQLVAERERPTDAAPGRPMTSASGRG